MGLSCCAWVWHGVGGGMRWYEVGEACVQVRSVEMAERSYTRVARV